MTIGVVMCVLISVIVPIYNVELYLRKCLDSLKEQTLREIEVICIDDGSTDRSGEIAEEYSREDARFKYIRTDNRGLSEARNRGIDEAKADYLMFVDSDDWVDRKFCEIPFHKALETDADMVIFGYYNVKNTKTQKFQKLEASCSERIINEFEACEYGGNAAWKRIYKRTLFDEIRYPHNRMYEDIATTHKLSHKAKRIVIIHDKLYYHVSRSDSITNTHSIQNQKDCLISTLEKYSDLVSYGYKEGKDMLVPVAISYLSSVKQSDEKLYLIAEEIIRSVNSVPKNLSKNQKIALIAYKINPKLFYMLSIVSGRLIKEHSRED